MKLGVDACALLACCSVLWAAAASGHVETDPPASPPCGSTLVLPSEVSSLSKENWSIHNRSLSPWRWRSSVVKHRIPSVLWEAECTSSVCSSPFPGHQGGQHLNSVPVYQSILVLNRRGGGPCYVASYQSVAVGCTCVPARVDQD